MSALAVFGIAVTVSADLVIPAVAVFLLVRRNHRRSSSRHNDAIFWWLTGVQSGLVALVAYGAVVAVFAYSGNAVIAVTILALPLGAVPAIFNTNLVEVFFTDEEWAAGAYQIVMTAYVVGMVAWAMLNAAGLRALVSLKRNRQAERAAP